MATPASETKYRWSSRTVGSVVGGASAVTAFVLLAFNSQGFVLLMLFTQGVFGIVALGILISVGAAIGRVLASANIVPSLRPLLTLAIAFSVALGPLTASFIEVALRESPLSLPADAQNIQWERLPWGEITLTFESAIEVPDLTDQLVEAAKKDGWICRHCQYQHSTSSGHASFRRKGLATEKSQGRLGFEVWSGQNALYGMQSSDLTQVRIFFHQRTISVELSSFVLFILLVVGLIVHSKKEIFNS